MIDDETPLGEVIATHEQQELARQQAAVLEAVSADMLIRYAIFNLGQRHDPAESPSRAIAVHKLKEALLWLGAKDVL